MIADVTMGENESNYNLSLYLDSKPVAIAEGLVKSLKLLHTFLSMNPPSAPTEKLSD